MSKSDGQLVTRRLAKRLVDEASRYEQENETLREQRDAFKGAFQILWNCHHGDEATCGCREHARALIAAHAAPSIVGRTDSASSGALPSGRQHPSGPPAAGSREDA